MTILITAIVCFALCYGFRRFEIAVIRSYVRFTCCRQCKSKLKSRKQSDAFIRHKLGRPAPGVCKVPPPGWRCTREPGHDGPCAAVPHG